MEIEGLILQLHLKGKQRTSRNEKSGLTSGINSLLLILNLGNG